MTDTPAPAPRRRPSRRVLFAVACVLALVVALVFTFIGDGVDVADAAGLRLVIVEVGHSAVWYLLTAAFAWAAWRGSWVRGAGALAAVAGIIYAVFLFAVFIWPS
jgi:hypothetical protein